MFDNKFLKTAKDPLVEAVKAAMQDGDLRRKAEALVNEEFGVYSRKALVREQIAAYDARLEEAYKCMKEGDVENIMNPNSNWAKKQAADKSNPFNEPTPDPTKVAPNIMMKGAGGDGSRTMVDKVKSLFKEGKKADKDYDGDGEVESEKDEYNGSRIAAAKRAGNLEELYGKGSIDKIKKHHDVEGEKAGNREMRVNNQYRADAEGNKASYHGYQSDRAKEIKSRLKKEETDYSAPDRAPVTKSAPKEDPSTPKEYPGAASSLTPGNPTSSRMGNAKASVSPIKEDEQLDELKQSTVRSYIDKAMQHVKAKREAGFKKDFTEKKGKKASGARDDFAKRTKGLEMAGKKLAEEEQIDEISKELAGKYIKHADYKRSDSSFQSGKVYGKELATKRRTVKDVEDARKHNRDSYKREKGINTAVNKLTGQAKVHAKESMMESIMAKLAEKRQKDDSSFKSAQVTETNNLGLGKSVKEQAVDMAPPPAIYGQQVPGQTVKQAPRPMRTSFSRGASQTPNSVRPTVTTSSKFGVQQGMSQAGRQAAASRISALGGMDVANRIGGAVASKAPNALGTVARVAAGPVVGGVAAAMSPTAANAGENEKARQAKYGQSLPNVAPGQGSAKNVGTVKGGSIGPNAGRTTTPQPAAAPMKATPSLAGKELQSTIANIAKTNKIGNVNKIQAGKTIDVGGGDKYTIQRGDNLTKIAKGFFGSGTKASAGTPAPATATPTPAAPTTDQLKAQFGSPEALSKDIQKSQEPKPAAKVAPMGSTQSTGKFSNRALEESFVTVGSTKYRII